MGCPGCGVVMTHVFVGDEISDARRGLSELDETILSELARRGHGATGRFTDCASFIAEARLHAPVDEVYARIVTLAQEFTIRYRLICGEGNFGSLDGDPAADPPHTECRLSAAGQAAIEGSLPVLLVNGAFGSRTLIPPHNLRGIARAATELLAHPEINVERLADLVGGPDFATGGVISGGDALTQIYATGRGRLVVDGRMHRERRSAAELYRGEDALESLPGDWSQRRVDELVITELPYGVRRGGRDGVVQEIADLVSSQQLPQVVDLRDESDYRGMRVIVTLRSDDSYDEVRHALLELTRVRTTIDVNMVAAIDGNPRSLDLRGLITAYLDQRRSVLGLNSHDRIRGQLHQLASRLTSPRRTSLEA